VDGQRAEPELCHMGLRLVIDHVPAEDRQPGARAPTAAVLYIDV
jgi:hypothetical protein